MSEQACPRADGIRLQTGQVRRAGLAWCSGEVVVPLIFRNGAAEVAFNVAVAAWLVFEFVTRCASPCGASGQAAPDPSAFILMPAFVVAVIAAELLGRLRGHHDPVPAQPDSTAAATRISHGLPG